MAAGDAFSSLSDIPVDPNDPNAVKKPTDPNAVSALSAAATQVAGGPAPTSTAPTVARSGPYLDPNTVNGGLVAAGAPATGTPAPIPSAQTSGGPFAGAANPTDWIHQQLNAPDVQSTDDESYWVREAAKDPKFMAGDPGAVAWWQDAIRRGNGSALVKSGQLSLRNAGSSAPGQGGGGASVGGQSLQSQDPRWADFYNQLLNRSQQSLVVDKNDPVIRAQTDAAHAANVRAQRQNLSAVAEAAGPSANISAEVRHAGEVTGQQDAQFVAGLMGKEVDARRTEIAQALSGQLGVLSATDAFNLKQEDQALQQKQLELQGQLGNRSLDITSQNNLWGQGFNDRTLDANNSQQAWDDQYKTLFG